MGGGPGKRAPARFNEAGPQGAGKPPETAGGFAVSTAASMRPARKGPENLLQGDLISTERDQLQ